MQFTSIYVIILHIVEDQQMKKKIITWIICISLYFVFFTSFQTKAETLPKDTQYHVVNVEKDGSYQIIKSSDSYAEAKVEHTLLKHNYSNLGITYGDSFLTIEQGIVEFQTTNSCSSTTSFINDANQKEGYTNGCYGIDAAFLEYNPATQNIKFKLSGVIGWVKASDVSIVPIENVAALSSFYVKDQKLYHGIKTSLTNKEFDTTLLLSDAPSYLKANKTYYSYDAHYFYSSFMAMIDDYRNGSYKHAVNAQDPYFNYYQYIDHRSTSNYSEKDITHYLKNTLAIHNTMNMFQDRDHNYIGDILTQSLLPQATTAFFQYQNQFGVNALMQLALSLNESALGRSYLAYTRNNLFGHAAYDSAVEQNAARYSSVANSVYSHALHYLSNAYLNPQQFQYHGGFFGNKAGGMNVSYASDPYWGEKAAQYYYRIDHAMGGKDDHQYALGINLHDAVAVYQDANKKSDILYTTAKGYESSFILLEKVKRNDGIWYRVQSDPALNKKKLIQTNSTYDFTESYGYVFGDDLTTIVNPHKIQQRNYINITFDANGGAFYPNEKKITLQVEHGKLPSMLPPTKNHALFKKWDITLEPAQNDLTYKAIYQDVKQIRLRKKPLTTYEIGEPLNVKDGVIRVEFQDGTTTDVALTTDMVSGFQCEKAGKQALTISYAGSQTTYEIDINQAQADKQKVLNERAAYIIKTYAGKKGLTDEAIMELEQFCKDIATSQNISFTNDQIRVIDQIFQENLKPRYSVVIKDHTYDLQVSGLTLGLEENKTLPAFMPETLVLKVQKTIPHNNETLAKKVASANGVTYEGAFSITGSDDFAAMKLKQDVVFSIKKPKNTKSKKYYVYYINGSDVYQLPTSQSDSRIVFTNASLGNYAIVSQNTQSAKQNADFTEVNTIQNNGKNYILRYIFLPIGFFCILLILLILYVCYQKKHPRKWRFKKFKKKHQKAPDA